MSQVTQSLEVIVGGGPASSQSLNKGEELVQMKLRKAGEPFVVIATMQIPETKERSLFLLQ